MQQTVYLNESSNGGSSLESDEDEDGVSMYKSEDNEISNDEESLELPNEVYL
jgi:hypothetical protein